MLDVDTDLLNLGRIVLSTCGRDKNRYFMVLQHIDENYVLIADGMLRRVEKPKKKKRKHLKPISIDIKDRCISIGDEMLTNKAVAKIIAKAVSCHKN